MSLVSLVKAAWPHSSWSGKGKSAHCIREPPLNGVVFLLVSSGPQAPSDEILQIAASGKGFPCIGTV